MIVGLMKLRAFCLFCCLAGWGALSLQSQEHNGVTLIEPSLIADGEVLVPGRPLTVAVRLDIAEGWHTYWENPGDSGIPAGVEWDVPEGVRVGPLQWPVPRKVTEPGDMKVYAYKDEAVLLARVFTRPDLDLDEVTIRARADWLVCRESCLPGDAELSLTLPVGDEAAPANTDRFAEYRERLPRRLALAENGVERRWERDGNTLYLLLKNLPEGTSVDFYPLPNPGVLAGHAGETDAWSDGGDFAPERVLAIPLEAGPADLRVLDGLLVLEGEGDDERKGWLF